jgi:hypothetical protein
MAKGVVDMYNVNFTRNGAKSRAGAWNAEGGSWSYSTEIRKVNFLDNYAGIPQPIFNGLLAKYTMNLLPGEQCNQYLKIWLDTLIPANHRNTQAYINHYTGLFGTCNGNAVAEGGAVRFNGDARFKQVVEARFERNQATFMCAAVSLGPSVIVPFRDTQFKDNFVKWQTTLSAQGGAVCVSGGLETTAKDQAGACTFYQNHPLHSHWCDFVQKGMAFRNTYFFRNQVLPGDGGALRINSNSKSYFEDTIFKENEASTYGGVMIAFGGTTSFMRSKMIGNKCDIGGGAITMFTGVWYDTNGDHSANTADVGGLAYCNQGCKIYMDGSKMNNHYSNTGGTLYQQASTFLSMVNGCQISNSKANIRPAKNDTTTGCKPKITYDVTGGVGGAIYAMENVSLTINGSTLDNNDAELGGGFTVTAVGRRSVQVVS